MYRRIALTTLLLPFFGYGVTKEVRIKELKEAQFQKVSELKSLMQKIRTLAYEYYVSNELRTFLDVVVENQSKKPENKNVSTQQLEKREEDKGDALQELLRKALFGTSGVEQEIEKTLLQADATFTPFEGVYIEAAVEELLLSLLKERAKKHLKEVLAINKELKSLQC